MGSKYYEAETDELEPFERSDWRWSSEHNMWYSYRTNSNGETEKIYRKADEAPTATVEPISTEEPEYIYEGSSADYKAPITASDGFAYNSTLNATVPYRLPMDPLSKNTGNATHASFQQQDNSRAPFLSDDGFAYGLTPTTTLPPAPAPALFISDDGIAYGSAPTATLPPALAQGEQAHPVIHVFKGAAGYVKPLDKSFRVRRSPFFIGDVFDILWDDTTLSAENEGSSSEEELVLEYSRRAQKEYAKIRRFTVIQSNKGHIVCLPVSTYGGRGYKRHGIHVKEHGFIYADKKNLQAVEGVNLVPIRIKLSRDSLKFSDPSLINYTKLYIIECNVEVRDFGKLDSKSRELLAQNFNNTNAPENQQGKRSWGSYATNIGGLILAGVAGGIVQGYVAGGGADERPSNDGLNRGPRRRGTTDESNGITRVNTTGAAYPTYSPSEPAVSRDYSPTGRYRSSQQALENLDTTSPSSSTNRYRPSHRASSNSHPRYSDSDNGDPSVISSYTPSARQSMGIPSSYTSARHNARGYSEQSENYAESGHAIAQVTSVDFSSPTRNTFEAISTRASTSYTQMILIYKNVHNPQVYMPGNVKLDSGNEGYNLVASSVVEYLELEPTDDTATITTYNGEESEIGGEVEITFSGAFREDGDQRYYNEKFRVVDMIHGGPHMLLNEAFMKMYCGPPGTLYMRAAVGKKLSKEDKAKKKAQRDKRKQKADEAAAVLAAQREADRDAEKKEETQKEVALAESSTAQGNSDQEPEDTSMKQKEAETASLLATLKLANESNDESKGKQKEVVVTESSTTQGNSDQEPEDTSMKQKKAGSTSLLDTLTLANESNDESKGKQKEVVVTDVHESIGGMETTKIDENKMG